MKWNFKSLVDYSYLFVLIAVFMLFVYTAFYTHPCYDDFSFSAAASDRSIFEDWKVRYFGWSGRYFFLLLLPFNPIVFFSTVHILNGTDTTVL